MQCNILNFASLESTIVHNPHNTEVKYANHSSHFCLNDDITQYYTRVNRLQQFHTACHIHLNANYPLMCDCFYALREGWLPMKLPCKAIFKFYKNRNDLDLDRALGLQGPLYL